MKAAAIGVLGFRVAYGAALLVAPAKVTKSWLGPAGDPTKVALRALGAREVLLHGFAISAVLREQPLAPWLAVSIGGDLSDIASTFAVARRPAGRRGAEDGRGRGRLGGAHGRHTRGFVIAFDRVGSGPPLVLLHALGTDRHMWDPVLERLAAEREVSPSTCRASASRRVIDAASAPADLAAARSHARRSASTARTSPATRSAAGWRSSSRSPATPGR